MHYPSIRTLKLITSLGCLCLLGFGAPKASAANVYFDINGSSTGSGIANGGSYSWESSFWSTSSAGTVATAGWAEGNFPEFAAGTDAATASYTVTTHSAHTIAGMLERTSSGTVTISGSTLTIAAGTSGGGGAGQGFFVGPGNITINNVIAGTGGIIPQCNSGCGNLTLKGNNTFSGGFNMGGGNIIFIGNANALGTGPIYFNGVTHGAFGNDGVMDFLGDFTIPNDVNMGSGVYSTGVAIQEQFIFDDANAHSMTFSGDWTTGTSSPTYLQFGNQGANQTFTISGTISGTTGFTNYGTGTLVLSGANTFGGTLVLANSGTIITVGGAGTLKSTLNIINAGTFNYNSTANQSLSGTISGAGALKQLGTGTLTLSGANSYTGGTTISGGILSANTISDANCSIGPSGTLTLSGGTLKYTGTGAATTSRAVTVSGTASIVDLANGGLTLSGAVKSGTINKNSGSTLTLSGSTDNASLGVVINGGTVVFNKASSGTVHAVGATTTVNSGGTLQLSGSGGDQIYQGVNVTVNSGGVFDANGKSEGMASLTLNGTGSGSGALINSAAAATATLTGTAATGFPLGADASIGGTGNLTLAGVIGGAHALTMAGSGTLKLNSANTYTGGTIINAGTLEVAGSIQGDVTLNAGILQLDNATALAAAADLNLPASPTAGAVNLNFNGTLTVSTLNFGGVAKAQGTWGSLTSSAQHKSAAFSGNGLLNVTSGATTTTTLAQTGGGNPCTYGDALTFTASVAGNTPSGTVQFYVDGVAAGAPVAVSAGSAAFSSGSLSVAGSPHTVTATYSGDDNNTGSTATPVALTVNAATLTVTANGLLTYGEDPTNAVYTPSYSGFVNGDTVSVVTGNATYGTDATATSYVGTNYLAQVLDSGTLSAANYTFAAGPNGVMTITNRPLWVTNALASDKIYDATTAATLVLDGAGLTNLVNGDETSVSLVTSNAAGAFADKAVGTGKTVTITGFALAGDLGTNYVLVQPTTTTANITAALLVVSATGQNKTYDGTAAASVSLTATPLGTDSVTPQYVSASFGGKNVGMGIAVSVSGITLTGSDAGNYTASTTVTASADITPRPLTVTATAADKVYDGGTSASVSIADDRVAGDTMSASFASAAFTDKAVGTGKTVTVSGITLSGDDAGNYSLASSTATATASITPRPLTVTVTAANKVYDGTAAASVTLADNRVSGDALGETYASALFADKHIGTGKTVTVSGISLSGDDAANYNLANTTATTTADITAGASLTVAGVQALDKIYDGTTNATLILSNATLVGVAGTDDVTLITTNAVGAFADKNVGTDKPVTISGLEIVGADAANYTLAQPATNATITPATLTVTATAASKVYDGGTAASVTLASDKMADDDVTTSYTNAAFADKAVATGKTVSVSGISLSGTDTANYLLANTSASTTADITARTLTVTATGVNRFYGATTLANVTLADDKVAGDDVMAVYGSASFADANVGTAKPVSVSGISLIGMDAGNYSLANTTASTTADIIARPLRVTATGVNKVYDGTIAATVTLATDKLGSDDVSASYGSASFADAAVGTGKAVSVSDITLSGAAAGNYSLGNTTASTTADITGAASSTVLLSSLNPATEGSNVTFTATVSSTAGVPAGDVVILANGVPFSTNALITGVASASTAALPVGTNSIAAQYATQANWLLSSDTLQQVVNSAVTYSQTNAVLGITANGDGTYTLNLQGTPGASYYVTSSADVSASAASWTTLSYSATNAPSPSGQWSVVVSNAAPAFYRSVAVNPAP